MVRLPVEGDGAFAWLPSLVELIQGSSRDEVLSDLRTGAREPAAILQLNLEGFAAVDRAGLGTLRRIPSSPAGKSFTSSIRSAAKLFTSELPSEHGFAEAVLPRLCITLERVSATGSSWSRGPAVGTLPLHDTVEGCPAVGHRRYRLRWSVSPAIVSQIRSQIR